jgi:hypothetical protein
MEVNTTTTPIPVIVKISWFYTVFYDDWSALMFGMLLVFLSLTAVVGIYWYPHQGRPNNMQPYNQVPTDTVPSGRV